MRQLLETLIPEHWEPATKKPEPGSRLGSGQGAGYRRVRWLQGLSDLLNRPVLNRASVSTSAAAVNANGAAQSTGVGTGPLQPKRYAEFTVKARVTINLNGAGPAYVYVYRTTGAIPANGAAPNPGDVIVGGDAFMGSSAGSGGGGGVSKFATSIGDGVSLSYAVNHGLGTTDIAVAVFETGGTKRQVFPEIDIVSGAQINVVFAVAPGANAYRVVVEG